MLKQEVETIKNRTNIKEIVDMKESKENGWVIVKEEGTLYDFTFSRTRTEAQNKWVDLWSNPNNWKAHYRKGIRCVKATQITQIQ